jgi:hypothetical protein
MGKNKGLTYNLRLYKSGKNENDLQQATKLHRYKIIWFMDGSLQYLTWEEEKVIKGFIKLWEKEAKARAAAIKIGEDNDL